MLIIQIIVQTPKLFVPCMQPNMAIAIYHYYMAAMHACYIIYSWKPHIQLLTVQVRFNYCHLCVMHVNNGVWQDVPKIKKLFKAVEIYIVQH